MLYEMIFKLRLGMFLLGITLAIFTSLFKPPLKISHC